MEIYDSTKDVRVVLRTPTHTLIDTHVVMLEIADEAGHFAIDGGQASMLRSLLPGELRLVKRDGSEVRVVVSWGSLTKLGNQIRIVARHATMYVLEPLPIAG